MAGKGHSPRPYDTATFGQNFDRIFRKSDPAHSLTPGTVREYRSDCCEAPMFRDRGHICMKCKKWCQPVLTKTNP